MTNEDDLIAALTNKQLIHKRKYCIQRGRDLIKELKELVAMTDKLKWEMNIRLINLEVELIGAECDRLDSENPFTSALLDLH